MGCTIQIRTPKKDLSLRRHTGSLVPPAFCSVNTWSKAGGPLHASPLSVHMFGVVLKYRVIHKSVKHFKNSQQIDYATDHGNSYVDRERNCLSFFF